jgi:hypothetical protein
MGLQIGIKRIDKRTTAFIDAKLVKAVVLIG